MNRPDNMDTDVGRSPASQGSGKAGIPNAATGGFGGLTFRAEGRAVFVEPKEIHKEDGRTNVTLGFPFATLEDYVKPDSIANDLAEYLSCPKRAAAPELYRVLANAVAQYDAIKGGPIIGALEAARAALAKARGEVA
jgi:hypothetical protein